MKRILIFLCLIYVAVTTPAFATNYQDWWWNSQQDGMGVNIGHQANTIAAAWYLYDSDGSSAFLILSGPVKGNSVSGNLYRSTGPLPGPGYDPSNVDTNAVGTGSITFTSDTTATLAYNYDGLSGSLELIRFSFGGYSLDGDFAVSSTFVRSNCQNAGLELITYDGLVATMTSDGNTLEIDQLAPSCTGSVDLIQTGSVRCIKGLCRE
jgi:hypothetical protein